MAVKKHAEQTLEYAELDRLCISTIRTLAIDAVERANSGHPGMPMGAAAMGYVLWTRFLRHNPSNPRWPGRDRFVLSAGHGSMLLYALLYLTGYDLPLDEIKRFRQLGSRTPGHPENWHTSGVETTTGPLGQGFANGVGMAMAAKHTASCFERDDFALFDWRVFGIVSDGDLMEGVASEAASLAGHLGLGNIIYLYDDNHVTIDGGTELAFSEDVGKRFEAYGWHTEAVADGNNIGAIHQALTRACAERGRPSLIRVRTHIGYGSPHRQDSSEAHGKALGKEEVKLTKGNYDWPLEPEFYVPERALAEFRRCVERGNKLEADWRARFARYAQSYPDLARRYEAALSGKLPQDWDAALPEFSAGEVMATRQSGSKAMAMVSQRVKNLFGGAADLNESTLTKIKDGGEFARDNFSGRNVHFGVREHAMCAALNGVALFGGLIPFGASFLIFTDYCRPSLRLAAMMRLHVIYVFTHDSIGLGEDGPTHQPVEHLASLRAIPGMTVIRPADANEAVEAWRVAISHRSGPVLLALTRQGLPTIDRTSAAPASELARGAYVLSETAGRKSDVILLASGSELHLVLAAKDDLERQGAAVRVVSMPSFELFEAQPESYRQSVLPKDITRRLAVEAGSPQCWHQWVGTYGDIIGMTGYGASAPYKDLMKHFNFTTEHVVARALKLLNS
jgi:transketolase